MLQISSTMLNVQVIIDTTHAHSNYDVAHSIQVMCYASLLPYTGGAVWEVGCGSVLAKEIPRDFVIDV